jgi:hypothetical protein
MVRSQWTHFHRLLYRNDSLKGTGITLWSLLLSWLGERRCGGGKGAGIVLATTVLARRKDRWRWQRNSRSAHAPSIFSELQLVLGLLCVFTPENGTWRTASAWNQHRTTRLKKSHETRFCLKTSHDHDHKSGMGGYSLARVAIAMSSSHPIPLS